MVHSVPSYSYPNMMQQQIKYAFKDIENIWSQIQAGTWHPKIAQQCRQDLHQLAGASGAIGWAQTNLLARTLEDSLNAVNPHLAPTTNQLNEFRTLLLALSQQLDSGEENGPKNFQPENMNSPSPFKLRPFNRANHKIYLIEPNAKQAADLAIQIGYFNYQVKPYSSLNDIDPSIQHFPDVLIIDCAFHNDTQKSSIEHLNLFLSRLKKKIPILFISDEDDYASRLQAVRSGGKAFFTKPIDVITLIDALDRLFPFHTEDPYHIMLVEDSQFQAAFYSKTLQSAGMITHIITDPPKIMVALNNFNPDLILLDMYMPDVTGMELAKMIRQIEKFVSIPIVFLSSETDRDIQLEAMSMGGDDFLSKHIKPEHLISSISSRVERYRKLRTMMVRDGLTGLYNHTSIKQQLELETARAARQKTPMSFAMLDLDLFKDVNDTFGHLVGDQVLKSLARVIMQRLRQTDIIGRYGGEEFAIIFPDTSKENIVKVMNEIRDNFSKIYHQAGEQRFQVTFSCGIAGFPDFQTANELNEAADQALYKAKDQGRNCIVVQENHPTPQE